MSTLAMLFPVQQLGSGEWITRNESTRRYINGRGLSAVAGISSKSKS